MPRLSDSQFQDYEFRTQVNNSRDSLHNAKTPTVTSVVAYRKANTYGDEVNTPAQPVGAMRIVQAGVGDNDYFQSLMNRGFRDPRSGNKMAHSDLEENSGQYRWTGGNMEPRDPAKVAWLGMDSGAPKTLLKGMMALGVAAHGSMPVADDQLSQFGSKISQGAARKYGVKPGKRNPSMKPTFQYADPDDNEDNGETGDEAALQMSNHMYAMSQAKNVLPSTADLRQPHRADRWQTFSSAQVGDITKNVETNMLGRKPGKIDSRVPVHPSQRTLF